MRAGRGLRAAVLVLIPAVIVSILCVRGTGDRVDGGRLVEMAMSAGARASYVAEVETKTLYCGNAVTSRATVTHQGHNQRIDYASNPDSAVWAVSTRDRSYTFLERENKLLVSENSRMLSDRDRIALLKTSYIADYSGRDKVAGRDAHVVTLSPRAAGRPSKKLWIDSERHTVLRSVDYSAGGGEVGRTETLRIDYEAPIDGRKFGASAGESVERVMVCKSGTSPAVFGDLDIDVKSPRYLPKGYRLEGYHLFNSQCNCNHRSAQITYTDGLNVVSVFQSPVMLNCGPECDMHESGGEGCRIGGCEMARTGEVTRGNKTVVVVGDLLPAEIKRIAESVR